MVHGGGCGVGNGGRGLLASRVCPRVGTLGDRCHRATAHYLGSERPGDSAFNRRICTDPGSWRAHRSDAHIERSPHWQHLLCTAIRRRRVAAGGVSAGKVGCRGDDGFLKPKETGPAPAPPVEATDTKQAERSLVDNLPVKQPPVAQARVTPRQASKSRSDSRAAKSRSKESRPKVHLVGSQAARSRAAKSHTAKSRSAKSPTDAGR